MINKIKIYLLILIFFPISGYSDENLDKSRSFIEDLGKEVLSKVAISTITSKERESNFKNLYLRAFDNVYISKFVLGRHWKKLDKNTKKEFIETFNKYLVMVYAPKFKGWKGEFKTVGAEFQNNMYIVAMNLVVKDSPPLTLDWRMYINKDKNFKILDVNIDGVSMLVTQRAEFSSVIKNNPLGVKGLIKEINKKIKL